jgi:hypothetical protein
VEEINLSSRLVFAATVCQKVVALFFGVDDAEMRSSIELNVVASS